MDTENIPNDQNDTPEDVPCIEMNSGQWANLVGPRALAAIKEGCECGVVIMPRVIHNEQGTHHGISVRWFGNRIFAQGLVNAASKVF